jgi:hypothetical protein
MNWKIRLRAAALHLMSCLIVAAGVAALVFWVWYPWPYRVISGGDDLLFLVMAVDVVMGPLITLAIFNVNKPRGELKRDLAIVVMLQLGALGYGLYTVFQARPAVLALEVDRFRVTSAYDVVQEELGQAAPEFRSLSLTGPVLVNTAMPAESDRLNAIVLGLHGIDLGARPKYWRTWDDSARRLTLKAGRPLVDWLKSHPERLPALSSAIARTGKAADELLILPVLARRTDWSVLIDRKTGDPIGFAPIDAP